MKKLIGVLLTLWLVNIPGYAQQRCDCSVKTGLCEAGLVVNGPLLEITTDTKQCAEVLFYLDGYPHVALVTDGREVQPYPKPAAPVLVTGHCGVCQEMAITEVQRLEVAEACTEDLLMPTAATAECELGCESLPSGERQQCITACQRHSHCLEENCVESLRQQYQQCNRRCDRQMQSSMEADIDVFTSCARDCKKIRDQISSCPVL